MKKYEKVIVRSIEMSNSIGVQEFSAYIDSFGADILETLYSYIDERLDTYVGEDDIDNLDIAFKYLERVLLNTEYDRELSNYRIGKLYQKINRIGVERNKKFANVDEALARLEELEKKVLRLESFTSDDINEYKLLKYIVSKNIDTIYLTKVFAKMPELVNTRDKKGVTLYQRVLEKNIESINKLDEEKTLYYMNILATISSQRKFHLGDKDKKSILQEIYNALDSINVSKGDRRQRKQKIKWMTNLKSLVLSNDELEKDIENIASRYQIDIELPKSLEMYYPKEEVIVDGLPVTQDYTISIDKKATIMDQALSCRRLENGNYLLGVHNANPLAYFEYDSPVIQEAISRGSNIYLPIIYEIDGKPYSKSIPMFDYRISADLASLKQDKSRYTRSHYFEISRDKGVVREFHPKTITRVDLNTSFDEVDDILKNGTKDDQLNETINNLRDITDILSPIYFKADTKSEKASEEHSDTFSRRIVDLTELLVGHHVATMFYENNRPCLYRTLQEDETTKKQIGIMIEDLKKTYQTSQVDSLLGTIKGLSPRGSYDIAGAHEGLHLDHYAKCCASLREASGLIVEHCYEVCFDREPTDDELYKLEQELMRKKDLLNQKDTRKGLFIDAVKRSLVKRKQ